MKFQAAADIVAKWAGSKWAFGGATITVLGWAVLGPWFQFSDSWSLFINTLTTIVTFLMVFLIQNSQNRGVAALQTKIDELLRVGAARNELIGLEAKTEEEIVQAAVEVKEAVQVATE